MLRRFFFLAWIFIYAPALAQTPEQPLQNAAQEERAQALFAQLRCVVCKGESIAESPAEVARDMRDAVRARIAADESDEKILRYFISRYGEFVLMKPSFEPHTWLLWGTPLLFMGLGLAILIAYFSAGRISREAKRP